MPDIFLEISMELLPGTINAITYFYLSVINKVMKYILIGGTFDGLHRGHREFIRKAFDTGGRVLVCITADGMVKTKPQAEKIERYEKREKRVKEFLKSENWLGRAETVKIHDPFSEGLRPELTHIIVSKDSRENGEKINLMRKAEGLRELGVIEIEFVKAKDGEPISDARIRKGEIDKNGNIL